MASSSRILGLRALKGAVTPLSSTVISLNARSAIALGSTAVRTYQPCVVYGTFPAVNKCLQRWIHTSRPVYKMVTFNLADIGEGIAEVEVLRWHKNVGEHIEEMENLCEVQSDKAAVDISSRYTGKVLKHHFDVGSLIKIGQPLCDIEMEETLDSPHTESAPLQSATTSGSTHHDFDFSCVEVATKAVNNTATPPASPAIRKLAKEMNVDLSLVTGTGKDGRVTRADLEAFSHSEQSSADSSSAAAAELPKAVGGSGVAAVDTEVPIRGFGRSMFKAMTETAHTPHMNIAEEVDVTAINPLRKSMNEALLAAGQKKITFTSILIKALSLALSKYPVLNSKVHSSGEKYTMFGAHNVSIAIDTPHGLTVPCIKNVQNLTLSDIQAELLRLQGLASNNKLSSADLSGGTVSLSNVGSIGGVHVTSLLFDGQALILGVGRSQRLPRYDSAGNVVARDVLTIAASADHRHCDGATVTRFVAELRDILQNPGLMLLSMR